MAKGDGRLFAKVLCSIWTDEDFTALTPNAQRMYLLLLSERRLTWCGVVGYAPKRWAKTALGLELEDVELAIGELVARRFVAVDEDTDEMLIRTYVRHDQVCKSWPLTAAMWKAWSKVESRRLRRMILQELPIEAWSHEAAKAPDEAQRLAQTPWQGPSEAPCQAPSEGASEGASDQPSTFNLQPSTLNYQAPDVEQAPEADPIVEELCSFLALHIEQHRGNHKRPKVTGTWRKDMGLLLRRGEAHVENPTSWTAEHVRFAVEHIFSKLGTRNANGFCWADQIQSPGNLRDKWHRIEPNLKRAVSVTSSADAIAAKWGQS